MDFLVDQNLLRILKPLGLAAVGLATITTVALALNRYLERDEEDEDEGGQAEQPKPAGIFNQGNTCFVNSMLQALAPLRALNSNLQEVLANNEARTNVQYELISELKEVLERINNESQSVDVVKFLQVVASFSDIINLEQQDAYELYSIIVSCFEQVFNARNSVSLCKSSLSVASEQNLQVNFLNLSQGSSEANSPTNNLLGYTKSSIICLTCKQQRNIKIQPFFDLSVDISSPRIRTLEQAIAHYQESESIEGWACTRCSVANYLAQLEHTKKEIIAMRPPHYQVLLESCEKINKFASNMSLKDDVEIEELNLKLGEFMQNFEQQYVMLGEQSRFRDRIFVEVRPTLRTITKQTIISKFPKILVLHLKQLSMDPFTGNPVLLRKRLEFPKLLQIPVRNGTKKYTLASLISHNGSEHYGHYFTFRKLSSSTENWFFISDTESMQVQSSMLSACMPYMLFYELIQ